MPLKMKASNGLTLIQKIGVPQQLYDWLAASGATVNYVDGALHLKHGSTLIQVGLTLTQASQAQTGTLHVTTKQVLSAKLTEAIKNMQAWTKPAVSTVDKLKAAKKPDAEVETIGGAELKEFIAATTDADATEALANAVKKQLGVNPDLVVQTETASSNVAPVKPQKLIVPYTEDFPVFDLEKMKTAKQVPLREANMMYQPVLSTSPGSRYYVVALSDKVKIAARYQLNQLSVRIEWTDAEAENLIDWANCGMQKSKNSHGSIHVDVPDMSMARRALGSVIAGTGVMFATPMPNLQVIAGL